MHKKSDRIELAFNNKYDNCPDSMINNRNKLLRRSSSSEQLTARGQSGMRTIQMSSVRATEFNKYLKKTLQFVYTHYSQAIRIHQMTSLHDINRLMQTFKTDQMNTKDNRKKFISRNL